MRVQLYSIGHSNHALDTFLALLEGHGIECIVDVRRFPTSRRWPHFNRPALEAALSARNTSYEWMEDLGGRRPASRKDSPHTAWKVEAFRHYADYTESEAFRLALEQLIVVGNQRRTAFMCAEALHWQCHRRLIADALQVRGYKVLHIQSPSRAVEHTLPDFARVVGERIVYDRGTQLSLK